MLQLEDILQIKEQEEVCAIVRRHWSTLVPGLSLAFILIVIPFFLLFPLFGFGVWGVAGFGLSVILGIGVAIRIFLLWDADVLVITTLRLVDVDQRGIFTRIVSDVPLSTIQDVSWIRTGILQTFLHVGTLRVQTAGGKEAIVVTRISSPDRIQERINDLRHATTPKRAAVAETKSEVKIVKVEIDALKSLDDEEDVLDERGELLITIAGLLKDFSSEELKRIESILRSRKDGQK